MRAIICININKFHRKKSVTHFEGIGMVPNAMFRMRDVGGIIVGSIIAVIQESIRKVAV
jgi:hypothetical protein